MIQIVIERTREQGPIVGYTVDGHANYDESGKDIVCAGVSAVVIGTVNALESLLQVKCEHVMDHGKLHVSIAEAADNEKAQLILESMVVMLQSIFAEYGSYMKFSTMIK